MAPDGEREVAIALPENEVAALQVGQPATVSLWSNNGNGARPPSSAACANSAD